MKSSNLKYGENRIHALRSFRIILLSALLAGSLDICAAFINSHFRAGVNPIIVLQFIASGILGSSSFDGGYFTAFLGLLFHYFITFTWAFLFFTFYPKINLFKKIIPNLKNKILIGLSYGIFIWMVMNLIVLPLSNVPPITFRIPQVLIGISFIMLLVGLPVSLMYHSNRQ